MKIFAGFLGAVGLTFICGSIIIMAEKEYYYDPHGIEIKS